MIGNFIVKLELQQRGSQQLPQDLSRGRAGDVFRFKVGRGGPFGELTVNSGEMTGPIGSERQLSVDLRRIDSSAVPPTR